MVLKELNFQQFLLWAGCGGLERTDSQQFLLLGGCGGPDRTDF